ncbi:MAG: hypothetical protein NT154_01600, partial [Verrucomicrobia bacterium]|nr:hypothetical protein [Verrucomicrobiota bacterium]
MNWKQTNPVWSEPRAVGRETWEALEKEIQGATNTLQEIRDALKSPAHHGGPYIPFWSSERRINFVAIRTAAQALAAATENDLHQGRLEAGLQNIEAIAGLARMEDRDYTLVAQMIRIAVAGMGLSVTWDALQAPGWTEPQLARLQKAWEGIDLVDALEIGLVGARAEGEGMFAEIRKAKRSQVTQWFRTNTIGKPGLKQRLEEIFVFPWYKLTSIDRDEILYLDYMQSSIEQARVLKAHRSWAEAKAESRKVLTKLVELSQGLSQYQHCVSLMAIPNFVRACQQGSHTETERQMTLAAIALKRFALRHGKLPPDLKTLVPELLTNVPF